MQLAFSADIDERLRWSETDPDAAAIAAVLDRVGAALPEPERWRRISERADPKVPSAGYVEAWFREDGDFSVRPWTYTVEIAPDAPREVHVLSGRWMEVRGGRDLLLIALWWVGLLLGAAGLALAWSIVVETGGLPEAFGWAFVAVCVLPMLWAVTAVLGALTPRLARALVPRPGPSPLGRAVLDAVRAAVRP